MLATTREPRRLAGRPDAHLLALLDHPQEPAPLAPCLCPWTLWKTTEFLSVVSELSSLRPAITRPAITRPAITRPTITHSAISRVVISPSAPRWRAQMSAISPFLKKPWRTMQGAR
ncbi:MAG: hypothetical protein AAF577_15210 [Pseudomonadota bacterium]